MTAKIIEFSKYKNVKTRKKYMRRIRIQDESDRLHDISKNIENTRLLKFGSTVLSIILLLAAGYSMAVASIFTVIGCILGYFFFKEAEKKYNRGVISLMREHEIRRQAFIQNYRKLY